MLASVQGVLLDKRGKVILMCARASWSSSPQKEITAVDDLVARLDTRRKKC